MCETYLVGRVAIISDFFLKRNGSLYWLLAHSLASFFGSLSWLEGALAGHVG